MDGSENFTEEELRQAKYYQAATLTTGDLVRHLTLVLCLTLWGAFGCNTTLKECTREFRWSPPFIKKLFKTCRSRRNMGRRTIEYSDLKANFEFLKQLLKKKRESAIKEVEALERYCLIACYWPPSLPDDQIWNHLNKLFSQQKKLSECVLQCSLDILKGKLKGMQLEDTKLRRRINSYSCYLNEAWINISQMTLFIKAASVECYYHLNEAPEPFGEDLMMQGLSILLRTVENMENWGQQVCDIQNRQALKHDEKLIEELYLAIIKKNVLYGIAVELNEIGKSNSRDFIPIHIELTKKQDRRECFKAIGRLESSKYYSSSKFIIDVNRWLFRREAGVLSVEKVYSLLRRCDTQELVSIEQLLSKKLPPCMIVSGPVASGKSCICKYVLNQWQMRNSAIRFPESIQDVVHIQSENLKSHSLVHFLKKIYPRSLASLDDPEVLPFLQKYQMLFIFDTGLCITNAALSALEQLARHLGKIKLMITVRPEKCLKVKKRLKVNGHDFAPVVFTLESLHKSSRENFLRDSLSVSYPNFSRADVLRPSTRGDQSIGGRPLLVKHARFHAREISGSMILADQSRETDSKGSTLENGYHSLADVLDSREVQEELFYPFYISYMLFIWLEAPDRIRHIFSIYDLFEVLFEFSIPKLKSKLTGEQSVFQVMKLLYLNAEKLVEEETNFFWINDRIYLTEVFFTFIACFKFQTSSNGPEYAFVHPCLCEYLLATSIVHSLVENGKKRIRKLDQIAFSPKIIENVEEKYTDTIKFVVCALPLNVKVSTCLLKDLIKMCGIEEKDYGPLLSLLHLGKWEESLVKTVTCILRSESKVMIPDSNKENSKPLCLLLKRMNWHPQKHMNWHPKEITVREILEFAVDALQVCTKTSIRLLLDCRCFDLKSGTQQDLLVKLLSTTENIVELSCSLGKEEAKLLKRMTKLEILHVHIDSSPTLNALSNSLHACNCLKDLDIHLDLPVGTLTKEISPLTCSAKSKVVTLHGITDTSWLWAVELIKKLNCLCKMVRLAQSSLSPEQLEGMKTELAPINVGFSK